jgi:sugar-specific transcriptional regulator TrmB/DNA-binding CsgD family transcriptional regulator
MLGALGLEPSEEAAYRALIGVPTATTAHLAQRLGLSEKDLGDVLTRLEVGGLVTRQPDGAYRAAPPAVALGALITERRDGLRLAEHALVTLAEEHRAAQAGHTIGSIFEVVVGVEAIRRRFHQVQQTARVQLRSFTTMPFVAVLPGQNKAETAAIDRGIRFRVVLERAVLEVPGFIDEAIDSLARGVEVRVVDELPVKLIIADSELALIPVEDRTGGEPGAVLLHRSGLLTALDALFETVWAHAHSLVLAPTGAGGPAQLAELDEHGLTELDRTIVALLVAGLSDQAVATQLDLSMRTLQRRLRHLMDLAGVRTRMQLGWHAAEHGWAKSA